MSTVFYGYRIKKDNWWEFVKQAKNLYASEGYPFDLYKSIGKQATAENFTSSNNLIMKLSNHDKVNIRLVEYGEDYIFQVLEHGYFFMNHVDEIKDSHILTHVSYDGRSESSSESKDYELVNEVCDIIESGKFFIFPLITEDDVYNAFIESFKEKD